jgi:hypothetical protein
VSGLVKRVVLERATGERPSSPRAFGAAFAVGTAVAVIAYRLLRHEGKDS